MIVPLVLVSLLAGSAHSANPLPSYMEGVFVLDTSNGFDGYMKALGVNIFTRTVSKLVKASNSKSMIVYLH